MVSGGNVEIIRAIGAIDQCVRQIVGDDPGFSDGERMGDAANIQIDTDILVGFDSHLQNEDLVH